MSLEKDKMSHEMNLKILEVDYMSLEMDSTTFEQNLKTQKEI